MPLPNDAASSDDLLRELREGGKRAMAAALTALETGLEDPHLCRLLDIAWGAQSGVCLGLTGPPGVGKSTLMDAMIHRLRAEEVRVGVIAVDPSSRRGGALLGDRARLMLDPADEGVFARSMAARSELGGLSTLAFPAMILMRAIYDVTLIETVGVGQSEIAIADVADAVALCVQPAAGDALQFMKAGIMEIPDLVLVTKSDLGAPARRAAADASAALGFSSASPPVMLVSAETGDGIAEAVDAFRAVIARSESRKSSRQAAMQAWMHRDLTLEFGRAGVALVDMAGLLVEEAEPFAQRREIVARLRELFSRLGHGAQGPSRQT